MQLARTFSAAAPSVAIAMPYFEMVSCGRRSRSTRRSITASGGARAGSNNSSQSVGSSNGYTVYGGRSLDRWCSPTGAGV